MKLTKELSTKQFILSHLLILILSLIFLGGIYYILNIQYQRSNLPFSNGPVTTLPKILALNLDNPDDNLLSFDSKILVSGKTSPQTEVLISTENLDLVIKPKTDGSFSTTLDLREGVNIITVATFDSTGDSKSVQKTVFYSKEKI